MVITDGDVIAMVMVIMDGLDGWSYYRDAMGNAAVSLIIGMGNAVVSLIIGMGNAVVSPSIITVYYHHPHD